MLEVQKQQQQFKPQSKIAVIGDTLEARLDHLADLAQKLDKDGTQHYLTAMDRFRQCGEVLLTAQAEIEGEKVKWRNLPRRQKEKVENKHLKPCTTFIEYIREKVYIEKDTAYFYMAITEGWEEHSLHECKTLTEALERMGKIKTRANKVEAQIQSDQKYQAELDKLSGQPETVEVIKEKIVEVDKPGMVAQSELDKAKADADRASKLLAETNQKNQKQIADMQQKLADMQKRFNEQSIPKQVTVIDDQAVKYQQFQPLHHLFVFD